MRGPRFWVLSVALIGAAAGMGLVTARPVPSTLPSVDNTGPEGLAALYRYLLARGAQVGSSRAWTSLDGVKTLVVAAPTARGLSATEVEDLRRFTESGGWLVYLMPPAGESQPRLEHWLGVSRGDRLPLSLSDRDLADPAGSSAEVFAHPGLPGGPRALRVGTRTGLRFQAGEAIPLAGRTTATIAAWLPRGAGGVLVFSSASFAQNDRLELEDNIRVWDGLGSRGLLRFDESHFELAGPPPALRGLVFAAVQLLICALVFAAASTRLGPPRVEPRRVHRDSLEYAQAFGSLLEGAHVQAELLAAQRERLKRKLAEGLAPEEDFGAAWFRAVADALAAPSVSPKEFLRLSQEHARLEQRLDGRRGSIRLNAGSRES